MIWSDFARCLLAQQGRRLPTWDRTGFDLAGKLESNRDPKANDFAAVAVTVAVAVALFLFLRLLHVALV